MALTRVGSYGSAASKTLGSTLEVFSPASAIPVGRVLLCAIASDNTATSDGPSTSVASVQGSHSGSFTRAGEYTNNASGAATGTTISLWYKYISTAIVAGDDTITVTFTSNIVAKCASVDIFNVTTPNFSVQTVTGGANDVDPAALTLSGLPSRQYLFLRADAREAGSYAFTPSTNYTDLGSNTTTDGGDETDVALGWEYRILTGTGDTTDPTMGGTQSASVYVAFRELTGHTITATPLSIPLNLKTATLARSAVAPHIESWSTQSSASTTSLACTLPSFLIEGSLMVAMVNCTGNATPSMPAGWTLIRTLPNGTTTGDPRLSIFGKFATASEVAPAVTLSTAAEVLCSILQVQGANPSSIFQTNTDATGTGSSVTYTSLTTSQANSLIISGVGLTIGVASGTAPPSGFTSHVDFGQTTLAMNIGSKVQAAAGSTGAITGTITNGTSSKWAAELIAISGEGVASYRMGGTKLSLALSNKNANLATTSGGSNSGGSTTYTDRTYTELTTEIANPERGWFPQTVGDQAPAYYTNLRNGADRVTMVRALIYLNAYIGTDTLPTTFLNGLRTQFANIRTGGAKAIIRFSYNQSEAGTDPARARVIAHINQLAPIIRDYADIILVWEAGFIGGWGEWAFSTSFGTPSPGLANYGLTAQQWADRKAVVDAELAILRSIPYWRTVTLRTPAFAFNMYGTTAISDANRYNDSDISRLGQTNDAFVSSSSDMNTYRNTATEYPWLAQQSKWTPMGGESAAVDPGGRSVCSTATSEMAMFHWDHCHNGYNMNVISLWQSGGCYENEMSLKLGYRLRLTTATLPDNIYSNSLARIRFTVINSGYSAPLTPRPVFLVLKKTSDSSITKIDMGIDVRDWVPGTYPIDKSIQLPALASGAYTMYLELPDEAPSLRSDVRYSVQLANVGTWDAVTGYNNLNHSTQASVASAGAYAMAANTKALTLVRGSALFQKTHIAGMILTNIPMTYQPATFNRGRSMVATKLSLNMAFGNITSTFNMAANQRVVALNTVAATFRRGYVMGALSSANTVSLKTATLTPTYVSGNGTGKGGGGRLALMQAFQEAHQRQVSEQRRKLAGTHHTNQAQKDAQNAAKQAEAKRKLAAKRRAAAEIKDIEEEIRDFDEVINYEPQFKLHPPALEQIQQMPEFTNRVATPQRMVYNNPAIQDEEQALELILLNLV